MKRSAILALAFAVTALAGCDSLDRMLTFSSNPTVQQQEKNKPLYPFVQMAPTAPPPSPVEMKPDLQAMGSDQWRPGYYIYDGQTFIWREGSLISRPSPTARWTADRWEQRQYGWVFVPGFWQ